MFQLIKWGCLWAIIAKRLFHKVLLGKEWDKYFMVHLLVSFFGIFGVSNEKVFTIYRADVMGSYRLIYHNLKIY